MSKVLVIGGGIAGTSAIVGLRYYDTEAEITLIEPKEYCEICWAAYRTPFDECTAKGSLLPLAPFCKDKSVKHIRVLVKALNQDNVELENGDTIEFDVCVVATGAASKWLGLGRGPPQAGSGDGTISERLRLAQKEGERILNAGSVLVVGGGLIGSELAGDIAGYNPCNEFMIKGDLDSACLEEKKRVGWGQCR
jgi:NADH dehydrogenase FAD-containing subunit